MPGKHLKLKFSLLQCTYWCSVGSFSSFAINYLQTRRQVSDGTAGALLAVFTCAAFIGQFLWGRLSDKWQSNRKVFIIANCIMLCACTGLYYAAAPWLIFAFYALLGFVQSALAPLLDSWILKTYADDPQTYGPIRSSASFVYALFTFGFGQVVARLGYGVMLGFAAAFIFCTLVLAFFTADAPAVQHSTQKGSGRLFTGRFVLMLLALLCIGMAGGTYTFMAVLLKGVGGGADMLGYTLFASAICQVPFILFSRKLARFTPRSRLIAAGAIYVFTTVALALAKTPLTLVLLSMASGAAYGITLPAMRELVEQHAPDGLHTTAQSVSDAVNVSLAGLMNSLLVSALGDSVGVGMVLYILTGVQLAGFVPLLLLKKRGS